MLQNLHRTSTEPPPAFFVLKLRVVREKLRTAEKKLRTADKKFPCAQFFSRDGEMTDTNFAFCYHWSYLENYRS